MGHGWSSAATTLQPAALVCRRLVIAFHESGKHYVKLIVHVYISIWIDKQTDRPKYLMMTSCVVPQSVQMETLTVINESGARLPCAVQLKSIYFDF